MWDWLVFLFAWGLGLIIKELAMGLAGLVVVLAFGVLYALWHGIKALVRRNGEEG